MWSICISILGSTFSEMGSCLACAPPTLSGVMPVTICCILDLCNTHECGRWHYTQASVIMGSEESAIYQSRGRNWRPAAAGGGAEGHLRRKQPHEQWARDEGRGGDRGKGGMVQRGWLLRAAVGSTQAATIGATGRGGGRGVHTVLPGGARGARKRGAPGKKPENRGLGGSQPTIITSRGQAGEALAALLS